MDHLGLEVVNNFTIKTSNGHEIVIELLLRNYGAKNGMCVVTDFSIVRNHLDELNEKGYGYSTLSELADNDSIDIESTIEMLRDWGWSEETDRPKWLND